MHPLTIPSTTPAAAPDATAVYATHDYAADPLPPGAPRPSAANLTRIARITRIAAAAVERDHAAALRGPRRTRLQVAGRALCLLLLAASIAGAVVVGSAWTWQHVPAVRAAAEASALQREREAGR